MGWLEILVDFLYPSRCLLCSRLAGKGELFCIYCGEEFVKNLAGGRSLKGVLKGAGYLEDLFALGSYEGDLRKTLHAFKYMGRRELSGFFAPFLAEGITSLINEGKWTRPSKVVPVPLHPRRLKERGFNQAELLAEEISTFLKVPLCNGLERIKYTQTQTSLGRKDRVLNLREAFQRQGGLEGEGSSCFLLIDDIYTSGATLNEAARILKGDDPVVIYGAVIAH